jgi:hypothetical protein
LLGKNLVPNKLNPEEIVAVQDIILEFILSNGWKDYNGFGRLLSERILKKNSTEKRNIEDAINFYHPFFSFNEISKKEFLSRFPTDAIINRLKNLPKIQEVAKVEVSVSLASPKTKPKSMVSIDQIFPEINNTDITTGKSLAETSLDIYERVIQNALRDYLREKNATNISERKKDGSLEVADIEDFTLRINGKPKSFSAVVKGAKSVGKKPNIIFEDVAHQILKANETHPDHVLLILAKPLADGVATKIVEYGADCGNRNLVIIMDSVSLARFLRYRKII